MCVGACRRNSSSQARADTASGDGSEAEPTSPVSVLPSEGDADGDGDADPLAPDEVSPVGPGSIFGLSWATERAASSTAGSTTQVTGAVARPLRLRSRSSRPSGDSDRCHERMPSSRPAAPRRTSFLTGTISASRVRGVPRGTRGRKLRARPRVARTPSGSAPRTCTPIQ